jgi:hypothetical protein
VAGFASDAVLEAAAAGLEGAAPMVPVVPALLPKVLPPPRVLPPIALPPVLPDPKVLLPKVLLPSVADEPAVPVPGVALLPKVLLPAPMVPGATGLPELPKVLVQGVVRLEVPVVVWAPAKPDRPAKADAAIAAASCLLSICMLQAPEETLTLPTLAGQRVYVCHLSFRARRRPLRAT